MRQGLITGGLNHAAHSLIGEPPQKGDTKLSHGSWGEVMVYDGTEWVYTLYSLIINFQAYYRLTISPYLWGHIPVYEHQKTQNRI